MYRQLPFCLSVLMHINLTGEAQFITQQGLKDGLTSGKGIDDQQFKGNEQNIDARSRWAQDSVQLAQPPALQAQPPAPQAAQPPAPQAQPPAPQTQPPAPQAQPPALQAPVGVVQASKGSSTSVSCGRRFLSESQTAKHNPNKRSVTSRVVGGHDATHGAYPWQVEVKHPEAKLKSKHLCGGTILNEDWILSAAHCYEELLLLGNPPESFEVVTGDFDLKVNETTEETFQLERIIIHEEYNNLTHDYDYTLLKIRRKNGTGISFSEHVQPACLPSSESFVDPVGMYCHVSGWGSTGRKLKNPPYPEDPTFPSILQEANVRIMDAVNCSTWYKKITRITPRMICAGFKEGGIDTCLGDSGGALACDINGNGTFTVLGVTSFGGDDRLDRVPCAQPKLPGIYAKVSVVLPWINRYIDNQINHDEL